MTMIPSTAAPAEVAITDHIRCICVIFFSSFSCVLGLVVCYVYFYHSHYRTYLRSLFNSLVVGAIVLQLVQAVCRIVAAGTLLSGAMQPWLCDALGGLEVFLNIAVLTMMMGFYYCVMALRYNPLRALLLLCMSYNTFEAARLYVWYVASFVVGLLLMTLSFVSLHKGRSTSETYFGIEYGYCAIPVKINPSDPYDSAQRLFYLDIVAPTSLLMLVSVASFVALRLRVSNMSGMTLGQSWPVYVRFFTINVYFLLTLFVSTPFQVASETTTNIKTAASVSTSLFLGVVSLSFLISERLLGISVRAFLCGEDDAEDHDALNNSPGRNSLGFNTAQSEASLKEVDRSGKGYSNGTRDRQGSVRSTSNSTYVSRRPKMLLNGFTSCIQSLLVLEVEGVQVVSTNQDLLLAEQDAMLTQGKYGSRGASNMTPVPRASSSTFVGSLPKTGMGGSFVGQ